MEGSLVAVCTLCGKPMGAEKGAVHSYHVPGGKPQQKGKPRASSLGGVCPKCGGTQFKAVRSTGRKVALGLASLLTSANQVECVTCGAKFKRG